jgi:hypothetical protein
MLAASGCAAALARGLTPRDGDLSDWQIISPIAQRSSQSIKHVIASAKSFLGKHISQLCLAAGPALSAGA